MHDLHNNSRALRVISPVAVGTTGTGQTGKVIDRQGYGGVEFICSYGSITATGAVFTATVKEGDVTGTLTSVADGDLLGTELLAGVAAAATRTSGTSKNVVKRVGYRGNKRYVNCSIKSTATAGTIVSCEAILYSPSVMPAPNP
ncbi:MAG TPA: hypothetical protein PLB40_13115 [Accumulibacter sp.]|jgi:hypothetical protein|nr:hypothetical protein [Accumulibacter sp.]